ncbi:MAG: RIP metalloprotease RseP [Nitrospinota bacterium]|nr:RIP metalloprotease RseP [Nitrospinota bacterium]MDH5790389.1 RIP metalloprotease RseP [Nitrospinota bacterium]
MFDFTALSFDTFLSYGFKTSAFLIGLASLIFIHELGHFLIARKCGVIVEKFSIGFGPKIIGFKSGGTEYLIAAIPLGGYVKMKGEDPTEELPDTQGSFSAASVYQRLAIAFGGPLFNVLFAIAIYFCIYSVGIPTSSTDVGKIHDDSPALAAGLQTGDRIIEIDGKKVQYWHELQDIIHNAPGKQMEFVIERDSKTIITLPITPNAKEVADLFGDKKSVGLIGIERLGRRVAAIKADSPADKAGLQVGDDILAIDDTQVIGFSDIKTAALDKPGQELNFHILRNGQKQTLKVTPELKTSVDLKGNNVSYGYMGLGVSGVMITERYSFFGAFLRGLEKTWEVTHLIGTSIKKLITGSISPKNIGGPIQIFQAYGDHAEQGLLDFVLLTALLSINLGLLNLLPIPVLDGGHILFFLVEIVKGKPISESNRERAAQVGLFMLLTLMVFAFYNDIMRVFN